MRIGILGSGDVGQALGRGFAARGHAVTLGSRTPTNEKLAAWRAAAGPNAQTGTFAEAASAGEVLVLASLGEAATRVLDLAGPANLRGKVLVDVTNPLDFSKGMPPGLFVGTTDSLGETVQRHVPEARVVKAFNTVPNVQMVDPKATPGFPLELPICGNDEAAKRTVAAIAREFGWTRALDLGDIASARWMEASVPLWVRLVVAKTGGKSWDLVLGAAGAP